MGRDDLLKCSQRWLCKSAGKEWFCNCFLVTVLSTKMNVVTKRVDFVNKGCVRVRDFDRRAEVVIDYALLSGIELRGSGGRNESH